MLKIAEGLDLKLTVGTDAHYLTKEDRYVHKAYLNSKDGEREVDDFYEFSRLMESDEVIELLNLAFEDTNYVNEILDINISEDESSDTIGGYICSAMGRIPEQGEIRGLFLYSENNSFAKPLVYFAPAVKPFSSISVKSAALHSPSTSAYSPSPNFS